MCRFDLISYYHFDGLFDYPSLLLLPSKLKINMDVQVPEVFGEHPSKSLHRSSGMQCPHAADLILHQPLTPLTMMRIELMFSPIETTISSGTSLHMRVGLIPAVLKAPGTESCATMTRQCKTTFEVNKGMPAAWAAQVQDIL